MGNHSWKRKHVVQKKLEGSQLNPVKERLAYELTSLIHGKEEADKALSAAKALFAGGADNANMPSTQIEESDLTDGNIAILDLMLKGGLIPSKGEGRRLVEQGGVSIDDAKVTQVFTLVSAEQLKNGVVVKKGKKVYHKFYI